MVHSPLATGKAIRSGMGTSTQRELRSQAQALQEGPSTTAVDSRAHLARSKRGAQASRMLRRSGQMSGSIQVKTHAAVSNSRFVSGRTGTITAGCTVGAPPPCGCCTAPGPSNPCHVLIFCDIRPAPAATWHEHARAVRYEASAAGHLVDETATCMHCRLSGAA